MTFSDCISRFTQYCRRHGFCATLARGRVEVQRALFSNREILLYCDLVKQTLPPADLSSALKIERKRNAAEITPQDLQEMTSFWNPKLAHRNIKERFELGASLWVIRSEGKLAGYVWTLRGRTVAPHYFSLAPEDVHFFDLHVFPQYRGRALNWFLITQSLQSLAAEGTVRAFSEVAEWNRASLSSFAMTPFRRFGSARKVTIFGYTIVCWSSRKVKQCNARSKLRSASLSTKFPNAERQQF